jgi:hypothetical protein
MQETDLKWQERKAPETPPMQATKETAKATSGGRNIQALTPEMGKIAYKFIPRPIFPPPKFECPKHRMRIEGI